MTICRYSSPPPPQNSAAAISEVVIWGYFTVQLVLSKKISNDLMSSIKTQTSYVSFIHIQHQCFKQNSRKEQLMFVQVCICIKS